ncbi:MAG: CDP-diacylglycerol--glycerol-3-phosphate 3-phosphatidyltransferase [Bdellovibrionota bacterium]
MAGRLLTFPNGLTALRLALMPLLAILVEKGYGEWGLVVLILAGLTDLFDGYFARRLRQESDVGRLMDPVADKIFLCVAVIFLMARSPYPSILNPDPNLSPWLAVLLLAREFLVTGLRAMAASVGMIIAAGQVGKIKTVLQFVGLGCIMLGGTIGEISLFSCGEVILWASVVLSYWSMSTYSYRVYLAFKAKGQL